MKLSEIRFPRELERGGVAEEIRRVLAERTVRIRPDSYLEIPALEMEESLEKVLRKARSQGRLRFGFEAAAGQLENEKRGIENIRERGAALQRDRVSRLLLVSNDGAARFYRNLASLLETHSPRVLGCLLRTDSRSLGRLLAGQERNIKLVLAEHKETVADLLRAIVPTGPHDSA